jgi:hypothetical protein
MSDSVDYGYPDEDDVSFDRNSLPSNPGDNDQVTSGSKLPFLMIFLISPS